MTFNSLIITSNQLTHSIYIECTIWYREIEYESFNQDEKNRWILDEDEYIKIKIKSVGLHYSKI